MKTIPLTQNQEMLIDDDDYEYLNQFNWHCQVIGDLAYAARSKYNKITKKCTNIYAHTAILGAQKYHIDHIDGNGLNNQKSNLRAATPQQNSWNAKKSTSANCSSKYKGVSWHSKNKKWISQIMLDNKSIYLGSFDNEIIAALSYNDAAKKFYGEFARPNQC
jgi:uncharacterized protein YueI